MNHTNRVTVEVAHGRIAGTDIPGAVRKLLPDDLKPPLSWAEPRPGWAVDDKGKPIADRQAADLYPLLREGGLDWVKDFPDILLDEARLFWPQGSVHLLSLDGEVRWFAWRTDQSLALKTDAWRAIEQISVDKYTAHRLRDTARFFGNKHFPDPEAGGASHGGHPLILLELQQAGETVGFSIAREEPAHA